MFSNNTHDNTTTTITPLQACGSYLRQPISSGTTMGDFIFTSLSAATQIVLLLTLCCRRLRIKSGTSLVGALESHLLPVHILFLRFCVGFYVAAAIVTNIPGASDSVRSANHPYDHDADDVIPCIVKGILVGIQHLCVDGVAVWLVQPGIGKRALTTTFKWTVPWAVFTGVVVSTSCWFYDNIPMVMSLYVIQIVAYYLIGFSSLTCSPCRQKRPAFQHYARWWIGLRTICVVADLLQLFWTDVKSILCVHFFSVQMSIVVCIPWLIFAAFQRDTAFWYGYAFKSLMESQGIRRGTRSSSGRRVGKGTTTTYSRLEQKQQMLSSPEHRRMFSEEAPSPSPMRRDELVTPTISIPASMNQTSDNDIRVPLVGLTLPNHALNGIAQGLDTLHRSDIVSFAELSMNVSTLLGAGGLAKVFPGTFRGRKVAFKLVFTPVITKETIQSFFAEASLLRACAHPNVIQLLGVCVAPPSMTLILELCDSSLYEELQERGAAAAAHGTFLKEMYHESGVESGHYEGMIRQSCLQQCLFFKTVAYQCVRAVSYLHSKGVLHCDIKSLNFLITTKRKDKKNNRRGDSLIDDNRRDIIVKLADMDLARLEKREKEKSVFLQVYEDKMEEWIVNKLQQWDDDEEYRSVRMLQCPTKKDFEQYLIQKVKIKLEREREREKEEEETSKQSSFDWSHRSLGWSLNSSSENQKRKEDRPPSKVSESGGGSVGIVGTPNWCGPELFDGKDNTRASDIYALGVVLWECLTLQKPYEGLPYGKIVETVMSGGGLELESHVGIVEKPVLAMLERCWSINPSDRPSGEELETFFDDYCGV